ncbi:hypothetical protein [Agrobacterium sp. NPDC089420]|uniref:hypothetical protein n=1 Tax=Agrobacterium sp. NPDC089420 TaxID=3363918 RepID=UPI00384C7372
MRVLLSAMGVMCVPSAALLLRNCHDARGFAGRRHHWHPRLIHLNRLAFPFAIVAADQVRQVRIRRPAVIGRLPGFAGSRRAIGEME